MSGLTLRSSLILAVCINQTVPQNTTWTSEPIDVTMMEDFVVGWHMTSASTEASGTLDAWLSMDGETYLEKVSLATGVTSDSGDFENGGGIAKLTGYPVGRIKLSVAEISNVADQVWSLWISGK